MPQKKTPIRVNAIVRPKLITPVITEFLNTHFPYDFYRWHYHVFASSQRRPRMDFPEIAIF